MIKLTSRKTGRPRKHRGTGAVQTVANSYCLRNYGVGYTGGIPQRLALPGAQFWIVPILFTSSGYGVVGQTGVLAIDSQTHAVLGATPQAEVRAQGARLAKAKRHDLDTAFYRARAT